MVVAVEPTPASARRLRANASLNDAPIQVVQAAVGRESGTAYLSLAADGRMNRVHRDAEGLNVRITTLDDLAQLLGFPDLVKLDVEGAELDALLGAKTVLAHHPTVLVEAHSPDLLAAVTELLQVNGYDVQRTAAPVEPFVPTMLVATRSRPT
jgi:FkbM family methyltransferase